MAMNSPLPKSPNWWIWGGGAIATVAVIGAALYGFDLIGAETSVAPPKLTEPSK
jgi:hypothetical protein